MSKSVNTIDTFKINAINQQEYEKAVLTINPLQNTEFKDQALVKEYKNRILFKEFYIDNQLFKDGCKKSKINVFIGCKNNHISIGMDLNNNFIFDSTEISIMPTSQKRIITQKINPKDYCESNVLLDSSLIHLIPFCNQVKYNDLSATDTMLQLTISRGYIKEFKLNDSTVLLSHTPTFRKDNNSFVYKYILKTPNKITAIYPLKDLLIFSGKSYNIQNSINKDELVLIPENNLSAIKIKQINKKLLDSLKLLKLRSNQSKQVAFTKELILLDFWATWCNPCIKSMPHLAKLSETNKDKLQIISICVDSKRNIKKAKITIKENKLKGFQYFHTMNSSTSSTILDKLGVIFFPTYILLDHTGKVLQFTNDLNSITL